MVVCEFLILRRVGLVIRDFLVNRCRISKIILLKTEKWKEILENYAQSGYFQSSLINMFYKFVKRDTVLH